MRYLQRFTERQVVYAVAEILPWTRKCHEALPRARFPWASKFVAVLQTVQALNHAESRNRSARESYTPINTPSRLGTFAVAARDGDRKQARARVNHRVDIGLLADPNDLPCFDCGHVYAEGERRHEYDHYRGYAAANQLDVQVVCTTCHHRRDGAGRQRKRVAK